MKAETAILRRTAGGGVMRPESGMSIVELVIASAILAVVITMTLGILVLGQDVFNAQNNLSTCQDRARRFIERVVDDIAGANGVAGANGTVLSIAASHTDFRFMVPVDHDNDGDVLNPANLVEYGAKFSNTQTYNRTIRYRFIQEGPVLNEAVDGVDYNMVGTTLSGSYVRGRIDRDILEVGGAAVVPQSTETVAKNVMLRQSPMDGDINGDGINDPLFMRISGYGAGGAPTEDAVNGKQIYVNVWIGYAGTDKKPAIANGRTAVRLRNVP